MNYRRVIAWMVGVAASLVLLTGVSLPVFAQSGPFYDVPADAFYASPVAELDKLGVFDSDLVCPDGFCPEEAIDRKTMAVWLVRVLDRQEPPVPDGSRFTDVRMLTPSEWNFYMPFIERLAELGVTTGCGDGANFCPNRPVSRAQMALFLARAFNLPPGPDPGFGDIPEGHWVYEQVSALKAAGITDGCGDGLNYCPSDDVTRGQMATFLFRATGVISSFAFFDAALDPGPAQPLVTSALVEGQTLDINASYEVYFCSNDIHHANFDIVLLDSRIKYLNDYIPSFFDKESNSRISVTFVRGQTNDGIILTSEVPANHTMRDWHNNRHDKKCASAAGLGSDTRVLWLADFASGGYAIIGYPNNPAKTAVVAIPGGQFSSWLGLVAHELGHNLSLHHPWDEEQFPGLCKYVTHPYVLKHHCVGWMSNSTVSNKEFSRDEVRNYLNSVMSYDDIGAGYGEKYSSIRDVESGRAYFACYDRATLRGIEDIGVLCDVYRAFPPDRPNPPVLVPDVRQLKVHWDAPEANGALIVDYDIEYRRSDSEEWTEWPHEGELTLARITGLVGGVAYHVRVQARNQEGASGWSAYSEGVPLEEDVLVPTVTLRRGDSAQSECISEHCYWLHVEIENFPAGEHALACAHNGVHQLGNGRGVFFPTSNSRTPTVSNDSPSTRDCFFGYPGNEVFVIVGAERRDGSWYGGVYSNTVEWDYHTPPPPPPNTLVDDNPERGDKVGDYTWFKPPSHIDALGYGDNGFWFTVAIGNSPDEDLDNWAAWEFNSVAEGRYEVQAWIPANWATAHAQYLIWVDGEYVDGPWLDQQLVNGWQTIGEYDLNGGVRIEVRDVRARDDWNDVGVVNARLAADAIRLVPVVSNDVLPGAVRNLHVQDVTLDRVELDWDPPSKGTAPFRYWTNLSTSSFPETSRGITNLASKCGRTRTWQVWAVNDAGAGPKTSITYTHSPRGCDPEYIYDDTPELHDNKGTYSWWKPPEDIDSLGYGSNGFYFTLAMGRGGDDDLDNWAEWEFGSVSGRYDIEAWIPANWATAHIQYRIWTDKNGDSTFTSDEYVAGPWLDQQSVSGWQSLGVYNLQGKVLIQVRDVNARDDYRDVGNVNARLAVDAIRLKAVS